MMERLTRPNLNVDDTAAKFMGEEVKLQDMPDRLLDLVLNGPTLNAVNKDVLRQFIRQLYGALKVYEDMEEQGRLNITPCKVGDKVYEVDGEHGIVEHTISEIVWVINSIAVDDAGNEWADYWEANEFEAAPKTREEAENALKGGADK